MSAADFNVELVRFNVVPKHIVSFWRLSQICKIDADVVFVLPRHEPLILFKLQRLSCVVHAQNISDLLKLRADDCCSGRAVLCCDKVAVESVLS